MEEKRGFNRWAILIAVLVAIAVWLGFCTQRGGEAPPGGAAKPPAEPPRAATQEAPKPEAPAAPAEAKPAPAPVGVTVLFEFDRFVLRPDEAAKLDDLAARIKGQATVVVDDVAHADRIGRAGYNQRLSERRAEAVKTYLAGKGIAVRIDARGETQPMTGDKCTKMGPENKKNRKLIECLQPDRRAEITLSGAR